MTHPQCFTTLNQDYLPWFHFHRKTVTAHSKIRNIIPHKLHLFEQKTDPKILKICLQNQGGCMSNITFISINAITN